METSGRDPLVTVVLTTYDRREFLPGAIESVAEQTYDPIELVVVDDHSPESPAGLVEDAPTGGLSEVVFVRHDENRGASAARNTGIDAAHGELIAFFDDDDRWKPEKIARQVDTFRKSGPEVGAVYTGLRTVTTDGTTIVYQHAQKAGDLTKAFLCGFTLPFGPRPEFVLQGSLGEQERIEGGRTERAADAERIVGSRPTVPAIGRYPADTHGECGEDGSEHQRQLRGVAVAHANEEHTGSGPTSVAGSSTDLGRRRSERFSKFDIRTRKYAQ